MVLLSVIANVATVLTICSHLTGTLICRDIYRAGSTTEFSPLPFIVGSLCSFLWFRYGLLLGDQIMIFVNIIGFVLQSSYLLWFYFYTAHKTQITRRIALMAIFFFVVNFYIGNAAEPNTIVGSLACMSSLFFCASPLALVSDVIRSKSTEKLPFGLIFSQFLVTFMWFVYGYAIGDSFVQLPNIICTLISGIQLCLFMVYPSKRRAETVKSRRWSTGDKAWPKKMDQIPLTKEDSVDSLDV